VPARPFIRPAFEVFKRGAKERFRARLPGILRQEGR
jgi:hypothetical protein